VRWEDGHEGLFFPQGAVSVVPVESTHG
jgi:hypothetical protein